MTRIKNGGVVASVVVKESACLNCKLVACTEL